MKEVLHLNEKGDSVLGNVPCKREKYYKQIKTIRLNVNVAV